MSAPQVLADTLTAVTPSEYVRFIADHSPLSFVVRGVLVEADSLVSV